MRPDPIANEWWWEFDFSEDDTPWRAYVQADSCGLAEREFNRKFPQARRTYRVARSSRPADQIRALGFITPLAEVQP